MQHSTASTPMPGSRKLKSADLRTSLTYCARVLQQKLEQSRETKEDDSWGDEEELVVRALPSKYRSANVGHFAQLLLKEVGWYFILPYTLNQPFDLHHRYGGVGFFTHNNLSTTPPPTTLLSLIEGEKMMQKQKMNEKRMNEVLGEPGIWEAEA